LRASLRIPQPEPHPQPFPEPGDPRRRPDLPPRPEPQPDGIPDPEPRPKPAAAPRAAIILGGILLLGACDQWALIVNSDGLLSITIVSDGGRPDHPYRVRLRQADGSTQVLDVPESGQLPSNAMAAGMLELTLLPPPGCFVTGPNPRNLMVREGEMIDVTFDVSCGG
jgi:hypothetical protein